MTPLLINDTYQTFGLRQADLAGIIAVIQQYTEIEEAIIFGSRAKGNFRNGSDVDIALKGARINTETTGAISYLLNEETPMPYQFDVINYHTIVNKDLQQHINRAGIPFYKKG